MTKLPHSGADNRPYPALTISGNIMILVPMGQSIYYLGIWTLRVIESTAVPSSCSKALPAGAAPVIAALATLALLPRQAIVGGLWSSSGSKLDPT